MPEEKIAETIVETPSTPEVAETETVEKETNDIAFEDVKQSPEENREQARKRREEERKASETKIRNESIIDTLEGKNPFTGEEMKDDSDVQEYLNMREIKRNGGDPLADFPKYLKEKERKAQAEAKEIEENNLRARSDIEAFKTENPNIDIRELLQDEDFKDYADGKVGVKSLNQVYRGFIALQAKIAKKEQAKAAQTIANNNSTPGSARNNREDQEIDWGSMSSEEFERRYAEIRKKQ